MDFERFITNYREEIIQRTQQLICINSVQGEAEPTKPFGKGPFEALQFVLGLGTQLGMDIRNVDGYAGHIEFGEGAETVGVLVHLDVVPEGCGWRFPPFGGEIYEGRLYGRGAVDDKGPTIAVLYAMKILMDSGVKLNKRIRMVLGTDEENGFEGIRYYLSKEKAFDLGFTPDASFPLICGEKGILTYRLTKKLRMDREIQKILSIDGGTAPNMVPGGCQAFLSLKEEEIAALVERMEYYQSMYGYKYSMDRTAAQVVLSSYGRTAHASVPQDGLNGISTMLLLLRELAVGNDEISNTIKLYNEKIGIQFNGEALGCNYTDALSGELTLNVGKLSLREGSIEILMDIRYPITFKEEQVAERLEGVFGGEGYKLERIFALKPIYFPTEHPQRARLEMVYKNVTKEEQAEALVTGGATYARAIPNVIAFGPVFSGEEELAHKADEYISIENLIQLTRIYTHGLYELARE